MAGKLIIFSAPSGTGKTTLVKRLLETDLPLLFSISATSRNRRQDEQEGKDYYYFTPEEFMQKIQNNEFLEWEEVYEKQFYGTLKSELTRIWQMQKHVIFDVDVIGGLNIKNNYPQDAFSLFIMPPSLDELKNRLIKRGSETAESLKRRLEKAEYEITFSKKFDAIIYNDDLEVATQEAYQIIKQFLNEK